MAMIRSTGLAPSLVNEIQGDISNVNFATAENTCKNLLRVQKKSMWHRWR